MSPAPIIVVGTGRCGSTLLSQILGLHPDVADVSEVFSFVTDFGFRVDAAFPDTVVDPSGVRDPAAKPVPAEDFWSVMATPQPRQNLLLEHGLRMPEVTFDRTRSRFEPPGVPPIVQATVPTADPSAPDALFDHLEALMAKNPDQSVADHYRSLFEAIAAWQGKATWAERSGGGLRLAGFFNAVFPEAKLVHLVRSGPATALSMQNHVGFRMALLSGLVTETLGVDPFESDDRSEEGDLSDKLAALLPERFSADAFAAAELPLAICGHHWSGEIEAGLAALDRVPTDRLLTLHYEDLVADPGLVLSELGQFVAGQVPRRWVDEGAALVQPRPDRVAALAPADRAELEEACRGGHEALARRGLVPGLSSGSGSQPGE